VADDKPQQTPPDDRNPILRDFALFGLIVGDLLGYTGAGLAIGWWLWKKQGAPWWVLLLLAGAGLSLAMYRIYKRSSKE
jgi:hypothetical protein